MLPFCEGYHMFYTMLMGQEYANTVTSAAPQWPVASIAPYNGTMVADTNSCSIGNSTYTAYRIRTGSGQARACELSTHHMGIRGVMAPRGYLCFVFLICSEQVMHYDINMSVCNFFNCIIWGPLKRMCTVRPWTLGNATGALAWFTIDLCQNDMLCYPMYHMMLLWYCL